MDNRKKLRLFAVRNQRTNCIVMSQGEPLYFSDKLRAKRHRDTLNAEADGDEIIFAVVLGPDHRKVKEAA